MIDHIIKNKLYDAEFVDKWCHGFDALAARAADYPAARAAEISQVPQLGRRHRNLTEESGFGEAKERPPGGRWRER